MAKIRSVKPEFWTDPDVVACSPLARLLWIGTWNHADDYGVLKDDPARLKLQILPVDQCDPQALVAELVERNLLVRRVAPDGTAVLVIRTYCVHQRIDKRSPGRWGKPDEFTDPPDSPEPTGKPKPTTENGSHPHQSPPVPTDPAGPQPDPSNPHPGLDRTGLDSLPTRAAERPQLSLVPETGSPPAVAESPKRRRPGTYPADFDAWWELYPRKVGKAAAVKAWDTARKTATGATLADGLARSIEAWQAERRKVQHIPHPATWLNQSRWEDDYTAPKQSRPRARSADALDRILGGTS